MGSRTTRGKRGRRGSWKEERWEVVAGMVEEEGGDM